MNYRVPRIEIEPRRASSPVPTDVLLDEALSVARVLLAHWAPWNPAEGERGRPHRGLRSADLRIVPELAEELLELRDLVATGPKRRPKTPTPRDVLERGRQLIVDARRCLDHVAALGHDPCSAALMCALEAFRATHPRARSLAAVPGALRDLARMIDEHRARGGRLDALEPDTASTARSIAQSLERTRREREAESALHRLQPSSRTESIARIEAIIRIVRAAARVVLASTCPDVYRAVTSQHQREARRGNRARSQTEPAPRATTMAGAVVIRRPRTKR